MARHEVTVIGVGNAYRSDDAVGLYVADQVRQRGLETVNIVEGIADGYSLIAAWSECACAFVIDCASSGAPPGTTYRFDALREVIPVDLFSGLSTHSVAVTDAIDLARVLNLLPDSLVVYGIEGETASAGGNLSPSVRDSANKVADCVVEEIRALLNP